MKILVTGASGFIGKALLRTFSAVPEWSVIAAARTPIHLRNSSFEQRKAPDLSESADWSGLLEGVDVVVHLAARAHVLHDTSENPLSEYRRINVDGTSRLAEQAVQHGVRRFIYLSSIKVNGEQTGASPFSATDQVGPLDAYGQSKWEAEQRLHQMSRQHGIECVVIRPPLVYGPGVKANFRTLMTCVYKGVPLPFGCVTSNRRSLVAVENLCSLIAICLDHRNAASRTFLVSDGDDISTAELLLRIGRALGKPARLIPIPVSVLNNAAGLLGKKELTRRLLGSLQVDIRPTCEAVGWHPPMSMEIALRRTAEDYKSCVR